MIGLIVTGHGIFPTGILSSVKLIAGEQEKLIGVDFKEGQGSDILMENIKKAINDLNCEEILILTDLAGGSPFNVSVIISENIKDKKIKVISGINLSMLLEVSLLRSNLDLDELLEAAKKSAIIGIKEYGEKKIKENNECFDGI